MKYGVERSGGFRPMRRSPKLRAYYGPNIYSDSPVVAGEVELDDITINKSNYIIQSVFQASRGWLVYRPDTRFSEGGERLVNFFTQWAHAALTHKFGSLGAGGHRVIGPNKFALWLDFHEPQLAASALGLSIVVSEAAMNGPLDAANLRAQLERLWLATGAHHPDLNTRILMEGAKAMGVPYLPAWNVVHHWQFGWGAGSVATFHGASNRDGVVSNHIMANKRYSKTMIEYLGFPVPADTSITKEEEIPEALERIGFPCVVKPCDQGQGRGVSAGLTHIDHVRAAFKLARQVTGQPIMIERHVAGSDHRLMVADGKLIGAFRRDPPIVTGDGSKTVGQLIEELNHERVPKGTNNYSDLFAITLDEAVVQHLGRQGVSSNTILPMGKRITLKSNGNISTGGTSTDVTEKVHPDVVTAAELIARSLGVRLAGFDYVTSDISQSWREGHGAFIELNLTPSLDVATRAGWLPALIGKIALGPFSGRIPLYCIIVKETDIERVEDVFAARNHDDEFGWASHRKAQIGCLPLRLTVREPWAAIKALLGNGTVKRAVILVSTDHLVRHGFPVDRASQTWNCDPDLPDDWKSVLRSASSAEVQSRDLDDILGAESLPYPTEGRI